MKCSVHADQTVIMVCRAKQCESCFVCVLCIAGSHNGHKKATVEEAGKAAKKRLKDKFMANVNFLEDQKREMERISNMEQTTTKKRGELRRMMETQGQQMHETVDKVITHMISPYEEQYEARLKKLKSIKRRTRDDIATIQSSEERLGHILETEDWLQIIQHEKKSKTTPKVEHLPKDTTPDIGAEEINKTLVMGVLSALQQCEFRSRSTIADEDTSDFVGTVYRQKSLQSVSSFSLGHEDDTRCVAPSTKDQSYIVVYGHERIIVCDKKGLVNKRLLLKSAPRALAITIDECLIVTSRYQIRFDGKQLDTFSTYPLMPNKVCVACNGDIFVTLVSSYKDHFSDIFGVVSRYTPQGKRKITFERDRFGNTICPKYIATSRVSDMVVITTLTNKYDNGYNGHVIVMTGDLQVKFR
ncbi:uncharacterized protein LOC110442728 [Mizuhopecten yessoensis]|uniref:uncharacterized protein LOC110442728 n=1 Tax=Mizuhopecten yessoensis TaxID=6573 RepID=UPI000B4580DB|nr:uncharacterized protein LOC110442728 [Mizuhopecten yessoensis]